MKAQAGKTGKGSSGRKFSELPARITYKPKKKTSAKITYKPKKKAR